MSHSRNSKRSNMQPIEYFTTKELLDEIRKRFDDVVFVGYTSKTDKDDNYTFFMKGSIHSVHGLASMMHQMLEGARDANNSD